MHYNLHPPDKTPVLARLISPGSQESAASLTVIVGNVRFFSNGEATAATTVEKVFAGRMALRQVSDAKGSKWATVLYVRENLDAFNRTYRQICDSLRIE